MNNNMVITETRPYLTFKLDDEMFAIDVSQVREILNYMTITKMPQMPDFMKGVINLRGSVVPVIDMRKKFGLEAKEADKDMVIVVMEIRFEQETAILGGLVDSVQEVFELEPKDIEPAPRIGARLRNEFIKGMGKRDDKFLIILDIDKVFSTDELFIVQTAAGENEADLQTDNKA